MLCFVEQDIDAEYVSLDDIVPTDVFDIDDSAVLDQNFYDKLTVALGERVEQCAPRVPVVTGKRSLFQTDTLSSTCFHPFPAELS